LINVNCIINFVIKLIVTITVQKRWPMVCITILLFYCTSVSVFMYIRHFSRSSFINIHTTYITVGLFSLSLVFDSLTPMSRYARPTLARPTDGCRRFVDPAAAAAAAAGGGRRRPAARWFGI